MTTATAMAPTEPFWACASCWRLRLGLLPILAARWPTHFPLVTSHLMLRGAPGTVGPAAFSVAQALV